MPTLSVKRLFAAPRYLSMPAVGVNISDQGIKYVAMQPTSQGVKVASYGKLSLEKDVVQNGTITGVQALVNQLRVVKKESRCSFVNVSLPEQQAYLFSTRLPTMKPEEVRDSLSLQMERFVPMPLEDIIFDFEVLSVDARGILVQVVAIDRRVVHSYLDAFEQAGFAVSLFEIEPQSVARALLGDTADGTVMVVDFGDSHTGISVVENGHVLFTSLTEINGNKLAQLIARELKLSLPEAHKLKNKYGLLSNDHMEAVQSDLHQYMQSFAKELQKAVQYWYTKNAGHRRNNASIQKIIFCGGNSHMPGLFPYLQQAVVLPIEKGNPWRILYQAGSTYVPRIPPDEVLSYTSAIGLALANISYD